MLSSGVLQDSTQSACMPGHGKGCTSSHASLVQMSKFRSLLLGWRSQSMNFMAVAKGLLLAPLK